MSPPPIKKVKWRPPPRPPVKLSDVKIVDQKIASYFDSCIGYQVVDCIDPRTREPTQVLQRIWVNPPSIVGLANALDCDFKTIYNMDDGSMYWDNREMPPEVRAPLLQSIARARQVIHEYTVHAALTNKSAQGPIFVLKNNFGWHDETQITQRLTTAQEQTDLSQLSTEDLVKLQALLSAAQRKDISNSDAISDGDYEDITA